MLDDRKTILNDAKLYVNMNLKSYFKQNSEAVFQRCSVKKEACNFIKKETLAQVFSCEFCEISENTFFYRTPLVAASQNSRYTLKFKNREVAVHRCSTKKSFLKIS